MWVVAAILSCVHILVLNCIILDIKMVKCSPYKYRAGYHQASTKAAQTHRSVQEGWDHLAEGKVQNNASHEAKIKNAFKPFGQ